MWLPQVKTLICARTFRENPATTCKNYIYTLVIVFVCIGLTPQRMYRKSLKHSSAWKACQKHVFRKYGKWIKHIHILSHIQAKQIVYLLWNASNPLRVRCITNHYYKYSCSNSIALYSYHKQYNFNLSTITLTISTITHYHHRYLIWELNWTFPTS